MFRKAWRGAQRLPMILIHYSIKTYIVSWVVLLSNFEKIWVTIWPLILKQEIKSEFFYIYSHMISVVWHLRSKIPNRQKMLLSSNICNNWFEGLLQKGPCMKSGLKKCLIDTGSVKSDDLFDYASLKMWNDDAHDDTTQVSHNLKLRQWWFVRRLESLETLRHLDELATGD